MSSLSEEFTHLVGKLKNGCFCWFPLTILCPRKRHQHGISIQSFINLSKPFFRISCIWINCTNLILGKAFRIFIFIHFPDSRLSVLSGLHFYFWWRDSENQEYGTSKAFSEFVGQGWNNLTALGSFHKGSCFWFKEWRPE